MIEDFFIDLALKEYTYPILILIMIIAFSILLLIAFREVRCWYWKVNERLDLQYDEYNAMQEMIELQKKEIELLEKALAKEDDPDTIDS